MDKDRDELLPCPFCGEKVISTFYVRDGRAVGCTDCAALLIAYQPDAEQKAIAAWNRRPKECEHIWMRSLRPDRVQGTWCGKCGVVAAPPEQLEQVAQPSREWLIAEISRLRRAIKYYAGENRDKRPVDEIVHAIEVVYGPAAPPAAEQKQHMGDRE